MNATGLGPPFLVISVGDPAGIGPEITLKAIDHWLRTRPAPARLAVAAPAGLLAAWATRLGLSFDFVDASTASAADPRPRALGWLPCAGCEPGLGPLAQELEADPPAALPPGASRAGGAASWLSLARAVDLVLEDPQGRALVTAPVCKQSLAQAGFAWPGHTEYLGWRCDRPDPLMWLDSPGLSVGLVSNHDALRDVPAALSPERVERKIRLACRHLERRHPAERLQLLALNPHAGDGGVLGGEERDWLAPLAQALRREGLPLDGPLPADAALSRGRGRFLALYHDQGLPVFKLVAGSQGVNTTLGLPLVRSSPDHGTAFDIAGRGVGDEGSLLSAMAEALRQLDEGGRT